MEKLVRIKTKDDHLIYGTLNYQQPSDKLIIFVHGLTGNQKEHIFYNAARFFPKQGFATFRFDLYCGEKKARHFSDATIALNAQDITTAIKYFKPKYNRIFVVGHSLGAPSILLSDTSQLDAIVLWDPTVKSRLKVPTEWCKYDAKLRVCTIDWGMKIVMNKKMYEEFANFPTCAELAKNVRKPIKIILAEKDDIIKRSDYLKYLSQPKEQVVIQGATHCFDEEGVEETLFTETLNWLKRYSGE